MNDTTYLRVRGEVVAALRGKLLDIRRKQSGLLTTPPGVAIATDLLNQAEAYGCETIQVTVEGGSKYTISLQNFKDSSFPIQRGDYEPQRACTFEAFERASKLRSDKKSARALDRMRKPKGQLSMWGPR